MGHGVTKKSPPTVSTHPSPNQNFFQFCFVVLQERLFQPPFALIRLNFQSKIDFFFSTYCWLVLILLFYVYVLLRALFHSSAIMKLRINNPSFV